MRTARHLTALLATTLAVGLATSPATASAADPTQPVGPDALWFTTSAASYSATDFWRSSLDGTDADLLVSGLGSAVPSPDGTRLAWTGRDARLDRSTILVSDLRGRNRTTVARTSDGEGIARVEWSPASDSLLVSTYGEPSRAHVTVVPLASAEPLRPVPHTEDMTNAAYVPGDPTRLVGVMSSAPGSVVVLRIGEAPTVLPGTSKAANGIVLPSPDGAHVAYESRVAEGSVGRYELRLVALDGRSSSVLLRDSSNFTPTAWSSDGAYLYGSMRTGSTASGGESGDIARLAVTGTPPAAPMVLRRTPALSETGIRLAPGPVGGRPGVSGLTAALNGSRPTLTWQLPAGAQRVDVYRGAGATPAERGPLVHSGLTTSFTDTVPLGTTWTWTVVAVDEAGERDAVRTRAVGMSVPVVHLPFSAALSSTAPAFDVDWAALGDLGTASYDVQWANRGLTGALGPWRTWLAASGLVGTQFGQPAGVPTKPLAGTTYAIRARSVDRFGNVSAWSAAGQTTVPLDQVSARFSRGWSRVVGKHRWLGAASSTTTAGRTATLRVTASRLQVIGERCPRCGRFSVTLDGRRVSVVDSRGTRRLVRQGLWTSGSLARGRVHTLVVTSIATAGRPTVVLDAFTVVR